MWECNECHKKTDELLIHWGESCGQKVDIIDYFCPHCPSTELTFHGTKEELNTWWDKQWEKT